MSKITLLFSVLILTAGHVKANELQAAKTVVVPAGTVSIIFREDQTVLFSNDIVEPATRVDYYNFNNPELDTCVMILKKTSIKNHAQRFDPHQSKPITVEENSFNGSNWEFRILSGVIERINCAWGRKNHPRGGVYKKEWFKVMESAFSNSFLTPRAIEGWQSLNDVIDIPVLDPKPKTR